MKNWIKQNINPPGIHKKNRGSLFSVIGKTFAVVKDDALIAFNAHFPYVADEQKLAEHGRALEVPRFINDSDQEYRDRVAAASFYHMKTGERGYIKGQLAAHFASRFRTDEAFLEIYLKVLDLTDDERAWAHDFLDAMVDPNISFNFSTWKKLIDTQIVKENWNIQLNNKNIDAVLLDTIIGIRLNLIFREEMGRPLRYDGQYEYDGSINYQQNPYWYDAVRIAAAPQNTDRVYHGDAVLIELKLLFKDTFNREIRYDGKYAYDGSAEYHSGTPIIDRFSVKTDYTEKWHDTGNLADQVTSGITVQPIAESEKLADRVTSGISVQPIVESGKLADRVTSGITVQPIVESEKLADRVTSGITLQPITESERLADRVTSGITVQSIVETGKLAGRVKSAIKLQPIAESERLADRVTSAITVQPIVETGKLAGRVTSGITVQPIVETVKPADRVTSGITVRPTAETAGMRSKLSIRVHKSTEYNGDITYDGSHDYGGFTVEEAQ